MGVAIGLFPLSTAWVRDGRLAVPLALRAQGVAYYLVCCPEERECAEMTSVRRWLSECFAKLPPLDPTPATAPPRARRRR